MLLLFIKHRSFKFKVLLFWVQMNERFAERRNDSNEVALSLRSRRSGTKFAAPNRTAH